jgi:hypothetical protein
MSCRTAATNWSTVHPTDDIHRWMWSSGRMIVMRKLKDSGEISLTTTLSATNPMCTELDLPCEKLLTNHLCCGMVWGQYLVTCHNILCPIFSIRCLLHKNCSAVSNYICRLQRKTVKLLIKIYSLLTMIQYEAHLLIWTALKQVKTFCLLCQHLELQSTTWSYLKACKLAAGRTEAVIGTLYCK